MTELQVPRYKAFAVVPVKRLADAKQRLGGALSADLRQRLVKTMLGDVLDQLRQTPGIEQVIVVSRDPDVANLARERAVRTVIEPEGSDLNAAIAFGLEAARKSGARRGLIVPGDVPLALAADFSELLAAADGPELSAIAPSLDGDGTNALLVPLPMPFKPLFGPASAARHQAAARKAGLRMAVVASDRIGRDIDTCEDLAALATHDTYAFLRSRHDICMTSSMTGPVTGPMTEIEALELAANTDLAALMSRAEALTVAQHGAIVSFSKKVFIPLTKLCRDVCHYCTFAHAPREVKSAYLMPDEVLAIAQAGKSAGCKEALFTLGDKPELRYAAARDALASLGYATTLDYLEAMAQLVLKETGLLPHLNPGVMDEAEIRRLRGVSVSMGIMLETASPRLSEKGGPHYGSPDKHPAVRLATLDAAGRAAVPFTTGILIGIGETRLERIQALLAIRDTHDRHGHIQEIIIQNFRAKPDTRMAAAPEPSLDEHLWTIAVARLIFGGEMNIQAPPNLRPEALFQLVRAGINDWGGISPVTPDHVNPEAPWPHLDQLADATEAAARTLTERTAVYPRFALAPKRWLSKPLQTPLLRSIDTAGFARDNDWAPGDTTFAPPAKDIERIHARSPARSSGVVRALHRIAARHVASEAEIVALFEARGADFSAVCAAADDLRKRRNGDDVTYVVNRNINYTNLCTYGCKFCAFSKGRHSTEHRDKPYNLELEEVATRTREAWERGATEVCLQGGIGPRYTGQTYLNIVEAVKLGAPDIHVHAFSPLEVWTGATTLKLPLTEYLAKLKAAGLSSLPGTAAEILDDEVRQVLCPDKINTAQWFEVMEAAHTVGLKTTATIMFGHVDHYRHWARHLLRVREQQAKTGGFTELVPLAFVHMESPIYLKGNARKGPTFRESVLMHAIARLVLDPLITNIQASWVKLGPEGAAACLAAGCNDVGGTLMNESITRAAGAGFGQEMTPIALERLIRSTVSGQTTEGQSKANRRPRQRSTFYGEVSAERLGAAFADCEVRPMSIMAAE